MKKEGREGGCRSVSVCGGEGEEEEGGKGSFVYVCGFFLCVGGGVLCVCVGVFSVCLWVFSVCLWVFYVCLRVFSVCLWVFSLGVGVFLYVCRYSMDVYWCFFVCMCLCVGGRVFYDKCVGIFCIFVFSVSACVFFVCVWV